MKGTSSFTCRDTICKYRNLLSVNVYAPCYKLKYKPVDRIYGSLELESPHVFMSCEKFTAYFLKYFIY